MIPTRWRRQKIMKEMGFCLHFMDKAAAGLRKYPDRYPNAVISSGHVAVFDLEMFLDWLKYRDALEKGVPVPEFNREEYQR